MKLLEPEIKHCAALNEVATDRLLLAELDWGCFDPGVVHDLAARVNVIIASDCLYDEREYDCFFALAREFRSANPGLEIYAAYEDRGALDCIGNYAACYGFALDEEENAKFWDELERCGVADKFNRNCYLFQLI